MKKCPYCAEEIQDEAIKCRYCQSDLTVPPPSSPQEGGDASGRTDAGEARRGPTAPMADTPVPHTTAAAVGSAVGQAAQAGQAAHVQYTHSGHRYVLGYGADFFGIWDRQASGAPAERYPRNDDGWRQAWTRFVGLEPHHVAVPQQGPPATGAAGVTTSPMAPVDNDALQYTHSGQRYLLGYGRTFFGVWDRTSPTAPVERFSRDDAGWQQAWHRFTTLETHYTEVGLGGEAGPSPASPAGGTPTPGT